MGYEQVENIKPLNFRDFSGGWWPNREHNEIPDNGSPDCLNVYWWDDTLNKMFGYTNTNSTVLTGTGNDLIFTGMKYLEATNQLLATAGTKIYEFTGGDTWTDRTGTVTITTNKQVQMINYRAAADTWIIGVTEARDAPFKWDGTGNAAPLGGSPPQGKWIAEYNGYMFIANTLNYEEAAYFSSLKDPETWDTANDVWAFDDAITGLGVFNRNLVVYKDDSIGIISGYGPLSFQKAENYVQGVGCISGYSIANGRMVVQDPQTKISSYRNVQFFLAKDGIYAFDGSQTPIKLSDSIENKFINDSSSFNISRLSKARGIFYAPRDWYILFLSAESATENDMMLIYDTVRRSFWPVMTVSANAAAIVPNTTTNKDEIWFGAYDGYSYKFTEDTFKFDVVGASSTDYDAYFVSKIFDMQKNWIIREVNTLHDEVGNWDFRVYMQSDLASGSGYFDDVSNYESGSIWGSFTWGDGVWGAKDFLFENAEVTNEGRFLQWKVENNNHDEYFRLEQLDIYLKDIGLRPNVY